MEKGGLNGEIIYLYRKLIIFGDECFDLVVLSLKKIQFQMIQIIALLF